MRMPSSLTLVLVLAVTVTTCRNSNSNSPPSLDGTPPYAPRAEASPLSDFERSLQFVRNGQFTYIYVFSRKDGKPLDSEDSQFLRTNAPQLVDRVATDDKKKLICGTNFNLEEGNLTVIKKRLVVEDYSAR